MNLNSWLRSGVLVAVAMTAACGGGGGSGGSGSAPVADAAVGGIWAGTATPQGGAASEIFGVVTEDGRAYFIDDLWQVYWGTLDSQRTTLSGSMHTASVDGLPFWDGALGGNVTLTGSVQSRSRLTANWSLLTSRSGTQQGSLSLFYEAMYAEDSSLAKVAGNYRDIFFDDGVINVASNGDIFSQSASSSCVVNGRVALIDPAWNAYDVQFTYSSCPPTDVYFNASFEGVAFVEPDAGSLIVLAHRTDGTTPEPIYLFLDPV